DDLAFEHVAGAELHFGSPGLERWRGKSVLCQYLLAFRRNNELSKAGSGRRAVIYDRQAVVGPNRQRLRQRHNLLSGVLALRHQRAGAIGEEDVGGSLGEGPAIAAAAGRAGSARWPAGELLRLLLECLPASGLDGVGFGEHGERVVAGGIGLRR